MRALVLALALTSGAALADEAADSEARYQTLTHELRCLVCQNQTIAESNAPLAADLRAQVKAQIDAGKSDQQIADYLTARYGDFVLYKPPFKARTALLWLGPFLVLLLAAAGAIAFMRRSRVAKPTAAPDPEAVKRLLDEAAKGKP